MFPNISARSRRPRWLMAATAAVVLLQACDLSTETDSTPATLQLTAIEVRAGAPMSADLVIVDQRGDAIDDASMLESIVWTSADTSIAVVDNGVVTGKKAGATVISAVLGELSAAGTVTVKPGAVAGLRIPAGELTISSTGASNQLVVEAFDAYANRIGDAAVEWSISDTTVAAVTPQGVLTGKKSGGAILTATSESVAATRALRVVPITFSTSLAPGEVVKSISVAVEVEVQSEIPIDKVTVAVDGGVEVPLQRSPPPQTPPSYRFDNGFPYYVQPPLKAILSGQYEVTYRVYGTGGVLLHQKTSGFVVQVPEARYTLKVLGNLGGGDSRGTELNERNQVAGWFIDSDGSSHLAFWDGDRAVELGRGGSGALYSPALNEAGVVVGNLAAECAAGIRAFRWSGSTASDPSAVPLECLDIPVVIDINDSGNLLTLSGRDVSVRTSAGTIPLPAPSGSGTAYPMKLNNNNHAYAIQDIGAQRANIYLRPGEPPVELIRGKDCPVSDLNDLGDTVYRCNYASGEAGGYILGPGSQPVFLRSFAVAIAPAAINNHRQIVGILTDFLQNRSASGGFLFEDRVGKLIELDDSWRIDEVSDINDAGVILAHGVNRITGAKGAVLLTPVR